MKTASQHFSAEQRQRIEDAVAQAESTTRAEIVPVVATASGRYDRGEDLAGLALALIAFVLAWFLFQHEDPSAAGWGGLPLTLKLPSLLSILLAGYVVGVLVAARVGIVRRLFTPRAEMVADVDGRAGAIFFDQRIHHTAAESGVLVYVSLFERRAVILADRLVSEHLDAAALRAECDALTADLKATDVADALVRCIGRLARRLADTLPADGRRGDELGNALITID